jgi:hypothetical protein
MAKTKKETLDDIFTDKLQFGQIKVSAKVSSNLLIDFVILKNNKKKLLGKRIWVKKIRRIPHFNKYLLYQ